MKWYFWKYKFYKVWISFYFSLYFTHCFVHYLIINLADNMYLLLYWVTYSQMSQHNVTFTLSHLLLSTSWVKCIKQLIVTGSFYLRSRHLTMRPLFQLIRSTLAKRIPPFTGPGYSSSGWSVFGCFRCTCENIFKN